MKNITYILLSLLLVFASCKKVDKFETYKVEIGEATVTTGSDEVSIEATYTYDYTLKSALLQYSDNSGLENAVSLAAQFAGGVLKATATGLKPATAYFYRFELDNGMTKMWTETGTFRTLDEPIVTELVVTTAEVSGIADTCAVCGGEVVSEGGSNVIARGVCYGLSENPSLDDCTGKTVDGGGPGAFTSTMTGLEKETKYYVRAYATNTDTTCYGEQRTFTTLGQIVYALPTVITNAVDETTIGQYSAMLSGVVTDDGNKPVTGCGFWYSTSHDTLGGITRPAAYSAGGFSLNVSDGIEPGTTYYARAYAENEIGRRFGNEVSFTTLSIPPTPDPQVFTLSSADVTTNSATIKGRVYYDGTENPIKKGFLYGTDINDLDKDADCTSQSDPFEAALTGLTPDTKYYYMAYATFTGYPQTFYGGIENFTTLIEITEPTIQTVSPSNITTTTANSGGYGITDGNSPIVKKGVCWAKSDNPTIDDCLGHTENGTGTADFTSEVTGLEPGTSYYVRAYAVNQAGKTGYGEAKGFVTMQQVLIPTVTTSDITNISQTTATGGGNVTNDGGATVTARGVCWSTSQNPTVSNSHTTDGTGTGTFTSSMTGLTANTTYYVRAYATNSAGTAYGGEYIFETTQLNPEWPDGDLPGVFSVSATHHVKFSKGNLQYKASTGTWKLADKQYISIKEGNSNISSTYDGWIDLYGFGTSGFNDKYPYMSSNDNADYPNINITCTNYDWGRYATITNATGEWRTLTQPEWDYLFLTRTNANQKYSQGTVNNEHGLIILPDSWILPSGLNFTANSNDWTTNNYTLSQWNQMEMAGAVFFPTTGVRYGTNTQNTTGFGGYWATNCDDGVNVDNLDFYSSNVDPSYHCSDRYCGRSVRLIRDVEAFEYLLVTTDDISNITSTTATSGGMVTSFGGATVTARGICWSTSPNPTVSNSHTTDGTGTGTFTSSMTGLTANTTYYVRAYATNSAGTAYGNQKTFTTAQEETGNYFCITALDAGTTTVSMAKKGNAPTVYLEYKKNNGTWTTFTVGSTNISLSQNDIVFFKAPNGQPNNKFGWSGTNTYNHFVIGGGNVDVSGNIMYLLDPTGDKITLTSANSYAFADLFNGCDKLASAGQLLMPATTLADRCYLDMFCSCTSLTTAPDLPATTLANHCYYYMFYGCTSLTTAPDLPATTLADRCYFGMFYGCTSLTTAPDLPATTLANWCYFGMFKYCTSLTAAPDLPATTLAIYCYDDMFYGCTSLTTAPDLPATTLADWCYYDMFSGCTSLTAAPDLPATTLAYNCYYFMFFGCTSLTTAPDLPATTLADQCYSGMFDRCTSLTTAPDLPATTLASGCYSGMFERCISLTTAPDLPATTLADNCYYCMFYGCTSLTAAPDLPATTLADNCYYFMFQDCILLTAAPDLPATTLADQCYSGMFDRCTSLTTAPDLPATTLAQRCYCGMFKGCSNLHYIRMLATENLNATEALDEWVSRVHSTGDFYKKAGANLPSGESGIPSGWTVHNE